MKAITYSRYGPPDVLGVSDVETPVPKDNEILIRVRAVEVTKTDCEFRSFRFPVQWYWLPLRLVAGVTKPRRRILGSYFAGEVASVGRSVTEFSVGDEVFGAAGFRIGADHFIDYMREDYGDRGQRYDVVFDMVPGGAFSAGIEALKGGGRYLCGNPTLAVMLRSIMTSRFSDKMAICAPAPETRDALLALKELIEAGNVRSIVDRMYPMEQAAEAHLRVETEQRRGAIVLEIGTGGA